MRGKKGRILRVGNAGIVKEKEKMREEKNEGKGENFTGRECRDWERERGEERGEKREKKGENFTGRECRDWERERGEERGEK